MNGVMKIIRHYLSISAAAALLLLLINLIVGIFWINSAMKYRGTNYNLEKLSTQLVKTDTTFTLSPEAADYIHTHCSWAMLLNDDGQVIWSMNLPSDIPLSYTSSEIAGFSKWYLNDYPVYGWAHDEGLFVIASAKNSTWKMQIEAPENMMRNLPFWLLILLISNMLGAVLLSFLLGIRFFNALRQILLGINDLAAKKPVHIHIKGVLKEVGSNINTASTELLRQQKILQKKDTARNNWIAGVSHDIRTPLSMIMGYSSSLENDTHFSEDAHKQFAVIRSQSERIKSLVEDLNLVIKLEYAMQPLVIKPFYLSELLRKVVVDYLNVIGSEKHRIELNISDQAQSYILSSDSSLFERALRNMLDNSIKHNTEGCEIFITLDQREMYYCLEVKDTGSGFSSTILEKLNQTSEMPTGISHGLGLFIIKQIAITCGAQIHYDNWQKGSRITLSFGKDSHNLLD